MEHITNFDRPWEEGPFGGEQEAFRVTMDTTGNIAVDPALPADQQAEAILSVVRLVTQHPQAAAAWLVEGSADQGRQAA